MLKNIVSKDIKALLFMKGYSERVPNKNLKNFCGKPLFHYILESINGSKYIDEIIINTDSEEIAKSASDNFDVLIHERPDHLLDIQSNEANLILEHDVKILDNQFFFQTHATNPLLKSETIDKSIESFFSSDEYDSLFSVTEYQSRFYNEEGVGVNHQRNQLIKTQQLPFLLEENSCIYIFSKDSFLLNKNRIGNKPLMFPIPKIEAVDIDTMEDFSFAESLMKQKLINMKKSK